MVSHPAKSAHIFYRPMVNGHVQIVRLDQERCVWEIQGIAAILWNDIDGQSAWDEIVDRYVDRVDQSESEYRKIAADFLEELLRENLVTLNSR